MFNHLISRITQFCEHKKIKSKCKDCGGNQICEHKRIKSTCNECDGSLIFVFTKNLNIAAKNALEARFAKNSHVQNSVDIVEVKFVNLTAV